MVSRNAPILQIFENRIAARVGSGFLGLLLRGDGQKVSADPIGAKVRLRCASPSGAERTIHRARSGSSGFSTQNSASLTIGVGDCLKITNLDVTWPDGHKQDFKDLEPRRMYVLRYGGDPELQAGYYTPRAPLKRTAAPRRESPLDALKDARAVQIDSQPVPWRPARDLVYLTFWASWCRACKSAQPQLNSLAKRFGERVDFAGLSLEPADKADRIIAYAAEHRPAYPLLIPSSLSKVLPQIEARFGGAAPALPSGVLIERQSRAVVWKGLGLASASDLERALAKVRPAPSKKRSGWGLWSLGLVALGAGAVLGLLQRRRAGRSKR